MREETKRLIAKLLLAAVSLSTLILSIVLLFMYRASIAAILVFPWIFAALVDLGINKWLVYSITIPLVMLLFCVFRILTSKDQRLKNAGYLILTSLLTCWCFGMYFSTRNFAFDTKTGQPIKCYAESMPGHYEEISCNFKIHPVYGTQVKPWDVKMVELTAIQKNAQQEMKRIEPNKYMVFFSPMGQPLVWYYENKDKIELFNQPGVHPQYGIILQPITSEIVRKVLSDLVKQEEKQLDAKTAELSATILVKSVETPIQEDGVINNQKPLLQQLGCYFPQDQSQKNGLLRNKANYDTYWLFFEEGISIRKCIVLAGKAKSISLPPGDYEYKIYKSLAGDNLIKHGVIDVSTISAEDKPWESWEVYNGENIDFSLKWNPFNNEDDNESINPIKPMERYPGRDNQP